jgi:hypothetical protein
MASEPQILYLEPDDEITSVIRRLRQTDASRIVLVAPARTKATSSAVALRLLAGVAAEEGRTLSLVADPLARAFAAEAGLSAFASVTDATADGAGSGPTETAPAPAQLAPIRVVRPSARADAPPSVGEPAVAAGPTARAGAVSRTDDTITVPVSRPAPAPHDKPRTPGDRRRAALSRPRAAPSRRGVTTRSSRLSLIGVGVVVVALLAVAIAGAALLPAATVRITPELRQVGPVAYEVTPADQQPLSGELTAAVTGQASGDHVERSAASGTVVFESGNPGRCRVPQGTRVAAGDVVFETQESVVVPEGKFTGHGIVPGTKSVGVLAIEPGEQGNVPAGAIDTIANASISFCLRGFPNTTHRLVNNEQPTSGGAEDHSPVIEQKDVDAAAQQIRDQLAQQLSDALAGHDDLIVMAPADPEEPKIDVPDDLVGKRGDATFELTGTLTYRRPAVSREAVAAAARNQLQSDAARIPPGTSLLSESIDVKLGDATVAEGKVSVATTVSGKAAPEVDLDGIRHRILGMSREEAQAALAEIGPASIELWPDWVSDVPTLDWRVSVEVTDAMPASSSSPEQPEPGAS